MVKTVEAPIAPFADKLSAPLKKQPITVLQINLGRKCNLACSHCHVEAGPKRQEEMPPEVWQSLVQIIDTFPQIETVDLTGGAPEMHQGFIPLVQAAWRNKKEIIVRSNLTIYLMPGYGDIPQFCADHQVRIVASLPCYLEENVDRMRGNGVFQESIRALELLNQLGYGISPHLILDLVYNPPLSIDGKFMLSPEQQNLESAYRSYLQKHFGIHFHHLFTITNLPIGRTLHHLQRLGRDREYLAFLADHFNSETIAHLMCRNELSIDYNGYIYDCDFHQMAGIPARNDRGNPLTISDLLEANTVDVIPTVQIAQHCYGCTAGSGSSCGGALL